MQQNCSIWAKRWWGLCIQAWQSIWCNIWEPCFWRCQIVWQWPSFVSVRQYRDVCVICLVPQRVQSALNVWTMTFNQTQMIVHGVYEGYAFWKASIMVFSPNFQTKQKKSFYKGPYGPTILLNARERSHVPMYKMATLVPSRLPRDQIECLSVKAFKNCEMSWL